MNLLNRSKTWIQDRASFPLVIPKVACLSRVTCSSVRESKKNLPFVAVPRQPRQRLLVHGTRADDVVELELSFHQFMMVVTWPKAMGTIHLSNEKNIFFTYWPKRAKKKEFQ
jgi:hypothetical protein